MILVEVQEAHKADERFAWPGLCISSCSLKVVLLYQYIAPKEEPSLPSALPQVPLSSAAVTVRWRYRPFENLGRPGGLEHTSAVCVCMNSGLWKVNT